MPLDLTTLFRQHRGHLSDKWEQYLGIYEAFLGPRVAAGKPLRLLEVGVQNGGSLQLWQRYLPAGSTITGIDVDPACARLALGEAVSIHIADASSAQQLNQCLGDATFDVIVDDGSHRSAHIVSTFLASFDRVVAGGLYVVEDLHASYMPALGGGFWAPQAAVEWLKLLADAIHADYLSPDQVRALNDRAGADVVAMASDIAALSFFDSVVVIEKSVVSRTRPFRRVMSGSVATVTDFQGHLAQLPREQLDALLLTPTALESFGQSLLASLSRSNADLRESALRIAALEAQLSAAQAEAANASTSASQLREELSRQTKKLEAVSAAAESALSRARIGEALGAELDQAQARAAAAEQALSQILNSSTWRATAVVRKLGARLPTPVRVAARRTAKLAWWTASGQLGERLRARRNWRLEHAAPAPFMSPPAAADGAEVPDAPPPDQSDAELKCLVADSGFFDAAYYAEANADVATSGIDALEHYLVQGWREGRDPSERFSTSAYLTRYPDVQQADLNPLVHYLRFGAAEGRSFRSGRPLRQSLRQLQQARWPALRALAVYAEPPRSRPRLNVVTDSVGVSSLFGGVGTSLILAALLCERLGATLRLVTRHDAPDAAAVGAVLATNGVSLTQSVETAFLPEDGSQPLGITDQDLFLTTSWWTTRATLASVPAGRLVYLLQEDERMFYPYGDERLLCSETLANTDVHVVVNTRLLLDHLTRSDQGIRGLLHRAVAFEPAFPGARPHQRLEDGVMGKKRFFFYARPQHPRNLFWRGAEALAAAIEEGILDPNEWEFFWVGRGVPNLSLPCGVVPQLVEGLDWKAYQALVASMDAAMVLMHTPHPSYPPLDLAGAGAAVLTNRFANKTDLGNYSQNIVTSEVDVPALCDGLKQVVALARDRARRMHHCASDGISRDWTAALEPVVDHVAQRLRAA